MNTTHHEFCLCGCGKKLRGMQTKYASDKCRTKQFNVIHLDYMKDYKEKHKRQYTIKVDRDYLNDIRREAGLKGAKARAEKLTSEQRSEISRMGNEARRSNQKYIKHKCPRCKKVILKLMPKKTKDTMIWEYCRKHEWMGNESDYGIECSIGGI